MKETIQKNGNKDIFLIDPDDILFEKGTLVKSLLRRKRRNMDKSVVRHAYVRKVCQPKRTEPEWPHTVVEIGFGMPYSDRFVSGAKIEGYFTIPKDEACPFKYGDLIQVTIQKVPRKLEFADQPGLALGA